MGPEGQARSSHEPWVWDRAEGYRALARYASVAALEGLALQDRRAYEALSAAGSSGPGSSDAARGVLRHLYEILRARRYPYALPEHHRDRRQRIRDAVAVHRDSGTCLDLSLLFAAMCKAAGLRPFIAILENHRHWHVPDHALVLVDLASRQGDISGPRAPVVPEEETDNDQDRWGVRRLVPGTGPVALTADGIAVDVIAACSGADLDFARAGQDGEAALTDRGYRDVHFVDILTVQDGEGEASAPREQDRAVIYPSLPPMPSFKSYASRAEREDTLAKATGMVILCGESGTGKSMLAHRVAATVDHGCGWFLDASSKQSLTTALAAAEAQAKGLLPEEVDGPELKRLSLGALDRLRNARSPWAVVLDNANVSPGQLGALPQADASLGQLLIITTTNQEWEDQDGTFLRLGPLYPSEVTESLSPDAPVDAIAGRPLLVDASRRFHRATGRWWWATHPVTGQAQAANAPAGFWSAVDDELGGADVARTIARAMCWLPPVRIRVSDLEGIGPSAGDVRAVVGRLDRLGIVDREGDKVTMHRLFREALRADGLERHRDGQVRLVHGLLLDDRTRRSMEFAADLDTALTMGELLSSTSDTDVSVRGLHALAKLFERHETAQASAGWYARVLARVGWQPGAEVAEEHRLSVVDSLRGIARARMRETSDLDNAQRRAELDQAIGWTREAERLCQGRSDAADLLAASQAEAMRGLLLRKRAKKLAPGENALEFLHRSEHALRHSYLTRVDLLKGAQNSPEVDRSQYNLAGLEIDLAQYDVVTAAAAHLNEAERHYAEILRVRRRRYRTDEIEEVVCCINGEAIVAYYRALLLDGSWSDRTTLLRFAAERADEAAAIRQRLAGPLDDDNTSKSVALMVKIALLRLRVTERAGVRAERQDAVVSNYIREIERLATPANPGSTTGREP